ncbi:MAG: sirohydrochlorin cobaltochelatase [Burkholderiales bacterium]|jgi:sirohydrochlorin cobaltochelatase
MKRALILFAHGARDDRWAAPFQRLQQILQAKLPDVVVSLAFLELMTPSLPDLVPQLLAAGCNDVTVVPVFFGQGGHVLRDLPAMTARLQKEHPGLALKVAMAVGENEDVLNAIAEYCIGSLGRN